MQLDDAGRRQLKFSLMLQSAAGAMLVIAFFVRVFAIGWDLVTGILFVGACIVGGAWTWTFRTVRGSRPSPCT